MKLFTQILALAVFSFISDSVLIADNSGVNTPADSWEEHPDGIAVAMSFITQKGSNSQKSTLIILLKNTSNSSKELDPDSMGESIEIPNDDSGSGWHALRKIDPMSITRATTAFIKPGQTTSYIIDLSPDESNLFRSHSIRLHIATFDDGEKRASDFVSLPRHLVETVTTVPTK